MMFLIFSLVVSLIFGLANIYVYKRLIKKIFIFKYFHKIFIPILSLLFVIQASFFLLRNVEFLSDEVYGFLAMLYAPTYCLFFMTLIIDVIKLILLLSGKYKTPHISLRILLDLIFIALGAFLTYTSIQNALNIPEVRNLELKIAGLKQDLKIAVLSDIHLGKNLHEDFLEGLIVKVNEQKPDMVMIVGDLVDTEPKNLEHYISKLDDFKSKYGTFYVFGNHEYYHGINEVLELLKNNTKMNILINENFDLGFINIAGLGDLAGLQKGIYAPDLARVKVDLDTSKPSILLAHQPKTASLYDLSDFDLVLSGHTHGGQIFPFMFLVKLNQGFIRGLYDLSEKTKLFVSTGAGFWGPSIRTFAQSEIVIITLKAQE
ncbi:MAG: metallophosphoesterase [Campylobacter sp.]|nr:metallophosphoesterase [Campylobacter sp.]